MQLCFILLFPNHLSSSPPLLLQNPLHLKHGQLSLPLSLLYYPHTQLPVPSSGHNGQCGNRKDACNIQSETISNQTHKGEATTLHVNCSGLKQPPPPPPLTLCCSQLTEIEKHDHSVTHTVLVTHCELTDSYTVGSNSRTHISILLVFSC